MPWYIALPVSVLILLASAFFVIIEFALLAARRSRLETQADASRTARSALRAMNQLTVMLAAAQLGVTGATFALGAVAEPAIHHLLAPVLEAVGLPGGISSAVSFGLALFIVTFLHLVVGEMVPKSWAIAHPETAARLVAPVGNGLATVLGPLLRGINGLANAMVRLAGEEPVDRAAAGGYDADTLAQLVEHSAREGALDSESGDQLRTVISLHQATLGDVVKLGNATPTYVRADATVADVQQAAQDSGHFRILLEPREQQPAQLEDGTKGIAEPMLMVHVRATLLADADAPARELATETLQLPESTTVMQAVESMRSHSRLLAVVVADEDPSIVRGVVTSEDLLDRVWPDIEEHLEREKR